MRSPTPANTERPPCCGGDVVDQLLDEHRLAHAGAAEQADLAALHVRGEQVDDLDAGLEDLDRRRELLERRAGRGGSASARRPRAAPSPLSIGLAEHVEDAAEGDLADRHRDRAAGVDHVGAAGEAVGGVHGDGAHAVVAEVLLHLGDQRGARVRSVCSRELDLERVVDRRAARPGTRHQ